MEVVYMNIDQVAFGQVATTLAKHFDSMYYVDIESDSFIEFFHSQMLDELKLPEQGTDFFAFLREQARRIVHPDDIDYVLKLINKEALITKITENNSSLMVCRFVLGGQIVHICHIRVNNFADQIRQHIFQFRMILRMNLPGNCSDCLIPVITLHHRYYPPFQGLMPRTECLWSRLYI